VKRQRDVLVRIGLPVVTGTLIEQAPPGSRFLVSANAFWSRQRQQFVAPVDRDELRYLTEGSKAPRGSRPLLWERLAYGTALDSAGFVAMTLYGGEYPWSVAEYVNFATAFPFDWYSSMDYCCEREIAADRQIVRRRVELTAERYGDCIEHARYLREGEGMDWVTDATPIVQGWLPEDYRECVHLLDQHMHDGWPELVGVGSVCRRQLTGPDGIDRILATLDSVLPPHVKLHLFGVKSTALRKLAKHPRIASIDSCAWDFAARSAAYWQRKAEREAGVPEAGLTKKTIAFRGEFMRDWATKQVEAAKRAQLDLFG
jgi:hypothetical protein